MNKEFDFPKQLPVSEKFVWDYEDCFSDYPTTKLCFAFCHKDYQIEMHIHEFYEINIIVGGQGVHYSKNGSEIVGRGDVFIVPPKAIHGYYNIRHLNVFHALFQASFFKRYSQDLELTSAYRILFGNKPNPSNRTPIKISYKNIEDFEELERTITRLEQSLNTESSYQIQNTEYVKSYILGMELILKLCQLYERKGERLAQGSDPNSKIFECIEYIHTNYNSKIDIKKLCEIACLSRTNFFKDFKRATGFTPNSYLVDFKMKMARKLLEETDLSVSEIASQVGCYDSSHFEKMFKKTFGTSPKKTRLI